MRIQLIIIILLIPIHYLFGQDWFSEYNRGELVKGFIISVNGDTIQGYIRYDYPRVMQKRINFSHSDNADEYIEYHPGKILYYSLGDRTWESINVLFQTYNGPVQFTRFGIIASPRGAIQLYRIFTEKDKTVKKLNSTDAETDYRGIARIPSEKNSTDLYIKKQEGYAVSVSGGDFRKNFVNIMGNMTSDCTELSQKIQTKQFGPKDLQKIIAEYNIWFYENKFSRPK